MSSATHLFGNLISALEGDGFVLGRTTRTGGRIYGRLPGFGQDIRKRLAPSWPHPNWLCYPNWTSYPTSPDKRLSGVAAAIGV